MKIDDFKIIFWAALFFAVWWKLESGVDSIGEERKAKEAKAYQEQLISLGPFVKKVIEIQPKGLDENLEIGDIWDMTREFNLTLGFQDYFLDNNIHISALRINNVQRTNDQYEYFFWGHNSVFALKCNLKPTEDLRYQKFIVTFKIEEVENNFKNSSDAATFLTGKCYEMVIADEGLFNDAKDLIFKTKNFQDNLM